VDALGYLRADARQGSQLLHAGLGQAVDAAKLVGQDLSVLGAHVSYAQGEDDAG